MNRNMWFWHMSPHGGESTPDPACLTHINLCVRGMLQIISKGIRIDNEPRLQMVVGLREKKPSLKVFAVRRRVGKQSV